MKAWKDENKGTLVIRQYKIKAGQKVPVRFSKIGPQKETIDGLELFYPGGFDQYNFFERWEVNIQNNTSNWGHYFERVSSYTKELKK